MTWLFSPAHLQDGRPTEQRRHEQRPELACDGGHSGTLTRGFSPPRKLGEMTSSSSEAVRGLKETLVGSTPGTWYLSDTQTRKPPRRNFTGRKLAGIWQT